MNCFWIYSQECSECFAKSSHLYTTFCIKFFLQKCTLICTCSSEALSPHKACAQTQDGIRWSERHTRWQWKRPGVIDGKISPRNDQVASGDRSMRKNDLGRNLSASRLVTVMTVVTYLSKLTMIITTSALISAVLYPPISGYRHFDIYVHNKGHNTDINMTIPGMEFSILFRMVER